MTDLLQLLIKIRRGTYLVMADVRQAFLMIKLSKSEDRNRFSILWADRDGKLVAYRYTALVLGFVSSPFILNHVIKYHIANYPNDECSQILKSNLYVDNLFFTGDNAQHLSALYKECYQRMLEGGFQLKNWASNCGPLTLLFQEDETAVTHSCVNEKVLGYRYFPSSDELALADFDNPGNCATLTKRTVLGCVSKVFDSLGFCLPVTVLGKIFIQKLWKDGLSWDEPLPDNRTKEWYRIKDEPSKLNNVRFPRQAYDHDHASLIVCCDSSKEVYGFSCYVKSELVEDGRYQLIFAKAKVAPTKSKTLPTLELMAAFLALKCLPTILTSLENKVNSICIAVDAQIVLSWILTCNVKTKNVLARNRVKDITAMRSDIHNQFNLNCQFVYINSSNNPADLLTRGLSYSSFLDKKQFWLSGPQFFDSPPNDWPRDSLGCLSDESKRLTVQPTINTVHIIADRSSESLLPIKRYSSLAKLFNITALVFMFILKLKGKVKSRLECVNDSKKYWISHEQSKFLPNEIAFLQKEPVSMPILVKNLNLFLDEEQIVRSRGRLENCAYLSYDVRNPILLPKQSFLTELFIRAAHEDRKHLGTASTLSTIRKSGLWIPKGRRVVKSTLSKCMICKKINTFAFQYPKVTDFVKDRVNFCGIGVL